MLEKMVYRLRLLVFPTSLCHSLFKSVLNFFPFSDRKKVTMFCFLATYFYMRLCRLGFRIMEERVAEITGQVEDLGRKIQLNECTVVLQQYDNSVYQVGGPAELGMRFFLRFALALSRSLAELFALALLRSFLGLNPNPPGGGHIVLTVI
jgi:hypothetical protein